MLEGPSGRGKRKGLSKLLKFRIVSGIFKRFKKVVTKIKIAIVDAS